MNMRSAILIMAAIFAGGCQKQPAPTGGKPSTDSGAKTADTDTTHAAAEPASDETSADDAKLAIAAIKQEARATGQMPPGHPRTGAARMPAANGTNAELPPGHPPLPAGAATPPPASVTLEFVTPEGWIAEKPSSSFRKAQYRLPHVEGDSEDGQVIVFFFGVGQGGPVAANLDRWRKQFTTPDGKPVGDDAAKIETSEAGGMKITTLDVTGVYRNAMMPGQNAPAKENYRMLAAIIEAPGGSWFVKGIGPAATMAKNVDAFKQFVASVNKKSG